MAEIKTEEGKKEKYLLYYDGESVTGKVSSYYPFYKVLNFGLWMVEPTIFCEINCTTKKYNTRNVVTDN